MDYADGTKSTRVSRWFNVHVHKIKKSKASTPASSNALEPEISQKFFQERGGSHHAAFAEPTQWDDQDGKWKAEERLAVEYLEEVLHSHDEDAGPNEPKFSDCSWVTVFKEIAKAKAEHLANGDASNARLLGIDLTNHIIDSVLPDEYGLKVIKGTLGLIFESTKRQIENRTKIVQAFEAIPETILTINAACVYLDPSEKPLEIQQKFYSTVLTELPTLVDLLLGKEKWYQKVLSFFQLRFSETMVIDDILDQWNGFIFRLREHVKRMSYKVMALALEHSSQAHRHAKEASEKLDAVVEKQDSILMALTKLQTAERSAKTITLCIQHKDTAAEAQTGMYNDMAAIIKQQNRDKEHYRQLWEAKEKEYRRLQDYNRMLSDQNRELSNENEILRAATPQPPFTSSENGDGVLEPLISSIELLGILGVRPDQAWDDLREAVLQGPKFGDKQLGHARWLLGTDTFLSWFRGRQSSILLVEGNLTQHALSELTPLSALGATLASSLVGSSSEDIVLSFFCGMHCTESGKGAETSGPNFMIRSLIAQLLVNDRLSELDLEELTEELLVACESHNIRALCQLFEQLVLQIPPWTQVYCILDGVTWYEDQRWMDELDCIAGMFQHLSGEMDADNRGRFFKVMMLFPTHSLKVWQRAERNPGLWKREWLLGGRGDPAHVSPFAGVPGVSRGHPGYFEG